MDVSSVGLVDLIYPAFAFLMVVVIPSLLALWVIYRTLTEKDAGKKCVDK